MGHKVLFVDDDPHITQAFARNLRREPYEILRATSGEDGLALLGEHGVDVVVSDEQMPGMCGSEFLAAVCRRYPDTIRIILTGQASLETAIRAINEGEIYRFLIKPCNPVDLSVTIRQAIRQRELLAHSRRLLATVKRQSNLLEALERDNPGITTVRRDGDGFLVMDDLPQDIDAFLAQLGCEVSRAEGALTPYSAERRQGDRSRTLSGEEPPRVKEA